MTHRDPSSPHDPLLRHGYGGQLESAAEAFLLTAFDKASGSPFSDGQELPPVLVSAAMHILNRSAWTQPSDEQVKASVYLGERDQRAPQDGPRRAA